jgi:hypothetical protein
MAAKKVNASKSRMLNRQHLHSINCHTFSATTRQIAIQRYSSIGARPIMPSILQPARFAPPERQLLSVPARWTLTSGYVPPIRKGQAMRRYFTIIASVLAVCLIVGLLFGQVTVSQVAPNVLPQTGRYHVAIADMSPGSGRSVVVCDTTTGQCWVDASGGHGKTSWRDLGTPTAAKGQAAQ